MRPMPRLLATRVFWSERLVDETRAKRRVRSHGRNGMMPALFLGTRDDVTCETMTLHLAERMAVYCRDLTVVVVDTGHWIAARVPGVWLN